MKGIINTHNDFFDSKKLFPKELKQQNNHVKYRSNSTNINIYQSPNKINKNQYLPLYNSVLNSQENINNINNYAINNHKSQNIININNQNSKINLYNSYSELKNMYSNFNEISNRNQQIYLGRHQQ